MKLTCLYKAYMIKLLYTKHTLPHIHTRSHTLTPDLTRRSLRFSRGNRQGFDVDLGVRIAREAGRAWNESGRARWRLGLRGDKGGGVRVTEMYPRMGAGRQV